MLFSFKILMMGDFGCGKTSLVRRFVENSFSEDYLSTIGVSLSKKTVTVECNEELSALMIIWDIEGDTAFRSMTKQYIMGAHGVIVVGDLTRSDTLESIDRHLKTCREHDPEMPVCIALNKKDLPHDDPAERLEAFRTKNGVVSLHQTSAKTGDDVEQLFEDLLRAVFKRMDKC